MSFEPMDPSDLTDAELCTFLDLFRNCALEGGCNRFFLDLMVIIEQECIKRHECRELAEYSETELVHAVERLKPVVDDLREQGVDDSYPGLRFLLVATTLAITEMEKRDCVKPLQ